MSEDEPPKTPEVEQEEEPQIKSTEIIASSIGSELNDIKEQLSAANNKVKQLEADLASKEENTVMLNEELNSIKDENKNLKSTEAENKETIKDLEHRLSQKELEITRLEGSVEDLSIAKKKIEDLQKEYKKLEEEMRAFQKIAENEPRFIILKDLQEFGEMRLNQVSMKAGVSPAQAKRWLEELERAGLIEIHGEGRDSNPLVSVKK
ncbi:MAG TPA: hypothetical protein VMX55_00835 [candidate division Zixibacteria bacterium]|nr:hypothetical protein [candidate division Zixibacteria bacterium]